ncbi:MAG: hypothetical protein LWW86_08670 [Micrococcales bacterium]|nr:hypothetical protein [Micrococcales bacterium]
MPTLTYPSEQFPGPPSVSVDIPESWTPLRVPGTLMAARETSSASALAPNIIVRGSTRPGYFSIEHALDELRETVEGQGGEMDPPFEITLDGMPYVGVNVHWDDSRMGQVVQAHLFCGSRRGNVVDLVQITGSVSGAQAREQYDEVQAILETARVVA